MSNNQSGIRNLIGLVIAIAIIGWYGGQRGWWTLPEGLGPTPTPAQWQPAGFATCITDTPDVACHWLDRTTCEYGWTCEGLEVIPLNGCPDSLYVEVREMSADNTVLGFTNDVTGRVDASQRARLDFTYDETGMANREITKVTCY